MQTSINLGENCQISNGISINEKGLDDITNTHCLTIFASTFEPKILYFKAKVFMRPLFCVYSM